jgi:hypothetical protein
VLTDPVWTTDYRVIYYRRGYGNSTHAPKHSLLLHSIAVIVSLYCDILVSNEHTLSASLAVPLLS